MSTSGFNAIQTAGLAALEREVGLRAQRLRNEMVESLRQRGKGRIYEDYFAVVGGRLRKVGKRNVPHQASAPGDAPAVDGGRLWQSIVAVKIAPGRWRVGTNLLYALYLEFGTKKIAPRPFIRTAADRERERPSP